MLEQFNKILPKSKFSRGVGVLIGGSISAQALAVLASPILTRLYAPEDFGLLAIYSAMLALFSVLSSLRYEVAIPLPEKNSEAANVTILSLSCVFLMTAVSSMLVYFARDFLALALNAPALRSLVWFLPIGVFLAGVYKVFHYWAVRTRNFEGIATTRISQSLATLSIQLLGYKIGAAALLFGQAGGQGVGSLRLFRKATRHDDFSSWSWLGVWSAAKRYKQFPLFSTWSGLFNVGGAQLPVMMFAAFFSAGSVGLYALANRIIKMPMSILGEAISKVYFADLSEAKHEGRLAAKIETGAIALFEVGLPAAAAFMIFSPVLFEYAFGEEWGEAGEIARWMTPWIFFQFISSPLSAVYFVLEKERSGLYFQVVMFLVRLFSILIGYLFFDFLGAIIVFSSVSALGYAAYCCSVFLLSGSSVRKVFFVVIKKSIVIAVTFFLVYLAFSHGFNLVSVIATAILLAFFYAPQVKSLYSN